MQTSPDLRSLSGARSDSASASARPVPLPSSRWKTRVLVPAAVILATLGVLAYAARDLFRPRTAVWVAAVVPKAIGVVEESSNSGSSDPTTTTTQPGAVLVQAPGWIEPAPYAISIPALTEGTVRDILVLEGDVVKAGQVVAHLLSEDSVLLLRAADANLAARQADLERARSAVVTAEALVRVEDATAAELRDEVTRKRELVGTGGVSAGEFRRMEIRLGGLDAKIAAAQRAVDEVKAAVRQAETSVATSQIAVEEAKLRVERADVRSPADGVVLARLVEPGSRVSMSGKGGEAGGMSSVLLRLYDPSNLQIRVDVPLANAAKVRIGTPCTITSEALPDQTFQGSVLRAVHEANIQRNTVQFKVRIDNPSPVLKPEMLTRVKLHAPAGKSASGSTREAPDSSGEFSLLVPSSAVAPGTAENGTVWVVEVNASATIARRRDVQIGAAPDEGFILIRSGLRLTDRVVLDPPSTLSDGASIRVLGERTSATGTHH